MTAEEIIRLRDRLLNQQGTLRTLLQETADLMFTRQNQITSIQSPGIDKMTIVYDTTAILDSQGMASGLSSSLIPTGQKFFGLTVRDKEINKRPNVRRYLAEITEMTHEEMFESNFMLQFNETLTGLFLFGTGNLFSEFDTLRRKLNYRDYDIALYQIREDHHGGVDTVILSFTLTPRQALQKFGKENLSAPILEALDKPDTPKLFEFIHYVGPREDRNPLLEDNLNMPWESRFVDVKEKVDVTSGGFVEFPFAVARWMKSSHEIWGRGQGTEVLRDVKMLQQMKKDFVECGNRWNNPPRQVVSGLFEGAVNVTPGAQNWVQQKDAISSLDNAMNGSFPITKDALEFQQEIIHKAFFRDIFVQLSDVTKRMTTVEIRERAAEGLRRLSMPVTRLQSELLNSVISRSVFLLMRNGVLPSPPPELQGQRMGIEYLGQLSLALKDQQARGFMQFAAVVGELSEVFPDASDNIDMDDAMPDIARAFGVKEEHIATAEQRDEKRRIRAEQLAAEKAMQMATVAGDAYKKGVKAPDPGSASEQLMEAVS